MFKRSMILCLAAVGASAGLCSAGVVFEPVRYQYGPVQSTTSGADRYYYYGGSRPAAVAQSVRKYDDCLRAGTNAQPPNFITRVDQTPIVYSDCAPYMNLSIYGHTENDARAEAYANVPHYFVKSDLLRAAELQPDGTYVVPAQAQPIAGPRPAAANAPTSQPAPQPILIIPKRLLEQPKSTGAKV